MAIRATSPAQATWSENSSFWIGIIQNRLDRYRVELTDPAVLDKCGDVSSLRVLDAGCGEGYLARELARRGADVTGIDFCPELIDAARETAAKEGIAGNWSVEDMLSLSAKDAEMDLLVSNHSVNEVDETDRLLEEFARVVKRGGRAIILMLHPCFFSWSGGDSPEYQSGRIGAKPYSVAGIASPAVATAHVGTLENYLDGLCRAGFSITAFKELRPTADQIANDEWWRRRATTPKFVLIEARRG